MLGISYRSVLEWIKTGKLKSIKPGKERFVPMKEIERFR